MTGVEAVFPRDTGATASDLSADDKVLPWRPSTRSLQQPFHRNVCTNTKVDPWHHSVGKAPRWAFISPNDKEGSIKVEAEKLITHSDSHTKMCQRFCLKLSLIRVYFCLTLCLGLLLHCITVGVFIPSSRIILCTFPMCVPIGPFENALSVWMSLQVVVYPLFNSVINMSRVRLHLVKACNINFIQSAYSSGHITAQDTQRRSKK